MTLFDKRSTLKCRCYAAALVFVALSGVHDKAFGRPDPGGGFHGGGGRDYDGAPGGHWSPAARAWHESREPRSRSEPSNTASNNSSSTSAKQEETPRENKTQQAIETTTKPIARILGLYPQDERERQHERDSANTVAAAAVLTIAPLSKPLQFLNGAAGPTPPTNAVELGGYATRKLIERQQQKNKQQPDGYYDPADGSSPQIVVDVDPLTNTRRFAIKRSRIDPYAKRSFSQLNGVSSSIMMQSRAPSLR
jgi:hypothetical protein